MIQEQILRIEYVEAMSAPEPSNAAKHDDWVSSVAGHKGTKLVLSGCLNNAGIMMSNPS